MGRVLDNFEPRRGRPLKYDWAKYSNGDAYELYRREDFDATLESFRTMLHRKAKELGKRVDTDLVPEDNAIRFRFKER